MPSVISNILDSAATANTAFALIKRDGSGNFAAGSITANLIGNASTATTAGSISGIVSPAQGGTGVANNAAATLTRVGNFDLKLTIPAAADLTLPIVGTLATLAGSETLTNKTLTAPVQDSYEDFTDISTPAAPGAGKTRVYSKNGNVYKQTATLPETLLGGGSGSGSKNYLANSTSTAAGWSYTGTATATTTTTTADLPEPSVGTGVLFTLGTAGNYSYARWTIDPADYNSPNIILKAAIKALGSYASGNAKWELYSNTASNYGGTSTKLALTTDVAGVSGISTAQNYLGFYDNPGASAPYMELRIVTVTAVGSLCMSSISTGPGQAIQSASISYPESFTPITSWTSNVTQSAKWRQLGNYVEIDFHAVLSGAPSESGSQFDLTLPFSWTVDTSVFLTSGSDRNRCGDGTYYASGGAGYIDGFCEVSNIGAGNNKVRFMVIKPANSVTHGWSALSQTNNNPTVGLSSGDVLHFTCRLPISQLAGAVTNLGRNAVEYASNNSTAGAADVTNLTNNVIGAQGSLIPTFTSNVANGAWVRYVGFQTPIQDGDEIIIQVKEQGGTGAWIDVGQSFRYGSTRQGAGYYGITWSPVNTTTIGVYFGAGGPVPGGATYAATSTNWPVTAGDLYRAKKVAAGVASGFGAATSTAAGLISRESAFQSFPIASIATDTGSVTSFTVENAQYLILGKTMTIALRLVSIALSGSPTQFIITIPGGKSHAISGSVCKTSCLVTNASTPAVGAAILVLSNPNVLIFERLDSSAWSGTCQVNVIITIPIS